MSNIRSLLRNIKAQYQAITDLIEEAPEEYRQVLKAAKDVGSLVIGLVPGGAIVTLVGSLTSMNSAKRSIKEAHDAFKGVPPKEAMSQLEKVREEASFELHKAQTMEIAKEREEKAIQHIQIDITDALKKRRKNLHIIEEHEILNIINTVKDEISEDTGKGAEWLHSPETFIALLHHEIKQINILIKEIRGIENKKPVRKLKEGMTRIIELRSLIAQRARELKGVFEETAKEEEKDFYEVRKAINFFQAQLGVLGQHKKALEDLLKEFFDLSYKHAGPMKIWVDEFREKSIELIKKHEDIEQKFVRSMQHIKQTYLDSYGLAA
jgi:hypothetical protein